MGTMRRILELMHRHQASDVYVSANSPVLIRIQGQCRPVNDQVLGPEHPRQLLAELLPASRLDELVAIGELNTAVQLPGLGNFRISAMRQRGGVAAVVRYIPDEIPPLASLSLPPVLAELVLQKRGLILVVGATGSGKSTTLAAMLDHRNAEQSGHILTIEDPIEFHFRNRRSVVNQREVGADTASLQIGLKNALRQAPDVFMIGEVRERETMSAALAYAQSGHLCLATLHANNSYQALNRILSFYPVEVRPVLLGDLAASLRAILSQRLLRGMSGTRVPAVEVLLNTARVVELIEAGDFSAVREAMDASLAEGSQTFEQDIARLVRSGLVERAEGLAWADSPTNLLWRLGNDFSRPAAVEPAPPAVEAPSFTAITRDITPDPP